MLIYIVNFVMLAVYAFFNSALGKSYTDPKTVRKFFVIAATAQLTLLLALRAPSLGIDLPGYVTAFELMGGPSFERYEVGYRLLYRIIGFFTDNAQVMIAVVAILSIVPVGMAIYRHSKMPFLSFALYIAFSFYAFAFSGLRQAIAYALTLFSYKYIKEKKFIKFLLIIVIASLFHKTSAIFVGAYFISKLKVNKFTVAAMVLTGAAVFVFKEQIAQLVVHLLYDKYTVAHTDADLWMIMCGAIAMLGLILYPSVNKSVGNTADPLYMLLLAGVVLMLFSSVSNNALRVANYYYMYVILFVPEVIYAVKEKRFLAFGAYTVVMACLVMYLWFLRLDEYGIVPYMFFWQG